MMIRVLGVIPQECEATQNLEESESIIEICKLCDISA